MSHLWREFHFNLTLFVSKRIWNDGRWRLKRKEREGKSTIYKCTIYKPDICRISVGIEPKYIKHKLWNSLAKNGPNLRTKSEIIWSQAHLSEKIRLNCRLTQTSKPWTGFNPTLFASRNVSQSSQRIFESCFKIIFFDKE